MAIRRPPMVLLTPTVPAVVEGEGDITPLQLKSSPTQTEPLFEVLRNDDSEQQVIQTDGSVIVGMEGTNFIKLSVPDPDVQSIIILEQINATSNNYISNQNGNQFVFWANGRFGAPVLDALKPSFQLNISPGLGDVRMNVDDGVNGAATLQYLAPGVDGGDHPAVSRDPRRPGRAGPARPERQPDRIAGLHRRGAVLL